MTPKTLLVAVTIGGVGACVIPTSHAEAADWDPGRRTTSRVAGEVSEDPKASRGDGVYGRFDGDFDLGVGLGAELGDDAARGAVRLSLHYFSTIGVTFGHAETLGAEDPRLERISSAGLDLKPAFLPRWSNDLERGPAFVDLTLDSLSVGVAAFFAEPAGASFGETHGLELTVGLGLPLLGRASGPWLEARGLFRWPDPAAIPAEGSDASLLLLLSWHSLFVSPLAD